jgi:apolipoprotein N-acyltransferase
MDKRYGRLHPYYGGLILHTALSLLTAVLLLLIFPKFDIRMLAPVALTPLLVAVARTEQGWLRFLMGWAAGTFYWFFLCTWIEFVLEVHGGMGQWGGWGSFFLFSILKALHLAVFSWLAGPLMRKPYAVPAVAALWVGLERTHGTFGFAWLALGNAGIDMSIPLRLAPMVGAYGVSFVFALLAAAIACVVLRQPRARLAPLVALLGLWALPAIPEQFSADQSALVIQPNIEPDIRWTPTSQQQAEQQLTALSKLFPAPLVIWPELPAPLYFYSDPEFHNAATEIARANHFFLFGTVAYTSQNQPLNSAVLLGPNGTEIGRYDKINLVPFGEFVPSVFSFVNRITHEAGDFVPGHDIKVMEAAGHRLGVFICYESAFPDLVRRFTAKGADVLVNLSNDAYFGHSEAREQHLLLARMRAIENRRFLIRATNDGITAVLNPAGRLIQMLPRYEQAAARVRYGAITESTFYARHGDWFAWGCLIISVPTAFLSLRRSGSAQRANRVA